MDLLNDAPIKNVIEDTSIAYGIRHQNILEKEKEKI